MTNEDIIVPASWSKTSDYPSICYACSHTRKKSKDKCLGVVVAPKGDVPAGAFNCNHCGDSGITKQFRDAKELKPEYQKPDKRNFTKLSDEGLQFFTGRGITQEVVVASRIVEEGEWLVFPYLENGELVNVKKRHRTNKKFMQAGGAKPIMFNYDRCKGQSRIIICEGEMDGLSFEVAGFTNHTSVNQGAPNAADKNIDKKLECVDNCYDIFEAAEIVYIAVDKDENGRRLEEELIRRIGAEKCRIVTWEGKYKDANELLLFEGAGALQKAIAGAREVRVEGVFQVADVFQEMLDMYRNGQKRGSTTYFKELDTHWTWRTGEMNIWTGYNNEGKTQFLLQLCLAKAMAEGWKFAIFSPENIPVAEFFTDLIHTYVGKTADRYYTNIMTEQQLREGAEFMEKHFFVVYPPKDFKLETIEEKFLYLIRKKGIRGCIIDPYNMIEHLMQGGEREDLYISRFMTRLTRFARENDVSMHLVAHQNTPKPNEQGNYPKPILYNIKGGGTFADKADNVLVVHRPNRGSNPTDTEVVFYSDKIKKQKLVGIPGACLGLSFNRGTNRYYLNGVSPVELIRDGHVRQEPNDVISIHDFRYNSPNEFEADIKKYQNEAPGF